MIKQLAGLMMVHVPVLNGHVSQTPVTNAAYADTINKYIGKELTYLALMRGLNGKIAAFPLPETLIRGQNKPDVDAGKIVRANGAYLYKLNPNPSPTGFDRPKQPVVCVSPLEAEGWCELAGQGLGLLTGIQMAHVLTGGGKLKFPTSTGELFEGEKRLLHGNLKLRDGKVVGAVEGDEEYNTTTCDVHDKRYPNGPFQTRLGGNVFLMVAGDQVFRGAYDSEYFDPEILVGPRIPQLRSQHAGFPVGVFPQDSSVRTV